jgi:hypothetical protein
VKGNEKLMVNTSHNRKSFNFVEVFDLSKYLSLQTELRFHDQTTDMDTRDAHGKDFRPIFIPFSISIFN